MSNLLAMEAALMAMDQEGGFNPGSLLPLIWYDFSDPSLLFTDAGVTNVSSDGDAIYQANDKSGNAYHATQVTLLKRPIYKTNIKNGNSVARLDGINHALSLLPVSATGNYTIFAVIAPTSLLSYLFDSALGRFVLGMNVSVGLWFDGFWRGSEVTGDSTWKLSSYKVVNNGLYRENGIEEQSGIDYVSKPLGGNTVLGADNTAIAANYQGDIAQFILYNKILSDAEIIDVETWLNNEYAVF